MTVGAKSLATFDGPWEMYSIFKTSNLMLYSHVQYQLPCLLYWIRKQRVQHIKMQVLYSVSCILYSVFYVLYSMSCILYPVFCILFSVFCILYHVSCPVLPVLGYFFEILTSVNGPMVYNIVKAFFIAPQFRK